MTIGVDSVLFSFFELEMVDTNLSSNQTQLLVKKGGNSETKRRKSRFLDKILLNFAIKNHLNPIPFEVWQYHVYVS